MSPKTGPLWLPLRTEPQEVWITTRVNRLLELRYLCKALFESAYPAPTIPEMWEKRIAELSGEDVDWDLQFCLGNWISFMRNSTLQRNGISLLRTPNWIT